MELLIDRLWFIGTHDIGLEDVRDLAAAMIADAPTPSAYVVLASERVSGDVSGCTTTLDSLIATPILLCSIAGDCRDYDP